MGTRASGYLAAPSASEKVKAELVKLGYKFLQVP